MRRPVRHYSATSRRRAATYDAVAFEAVHGSSLDVLPPPGATVLDIGSGSGRDALALASRGYRVTAAEPSRALREHARSHDDAGLVTWVDDQLPELPRLIGEGARFQFILCSAVVMHLSEGELRPAFSTMATLLAAGGRLVVSARDEVQNDPPGLVTTHRSRNLKAAAQKARLRLVRASRSTDALGRPGFRWRIFIFETAGEEPIPRLRSRT